MADHIQQVLSHQLLKHLKLSNLAILQNFMLETAIFHSAIFSAIRAESTVFRRNTCGFIDAREIEILRVAGALKGQRTLNMAEPPYYSKGEWTQ